MDLTFVMSETPARWRNNINIFINDLNFVKFERLDFIKILKYIVSF